jgi:hypothetical protein
MIEYQAGAYEKMIGDIDIKLGAAENIKGL